MTANFEEALIDDAERVSDQEALTMAHWLLRNEGLFVGSSSALNLAAACRVARSLPEGSRVVTIICDSGHRHLSRFWSQEYIAGAAGTYNVSWPASDCVPECLHNLA